MAILEFEAISEMERWATEYADAKRYLIIVARRELIMKPTKSTKNLDTGYFVGSTLEKVQDIAKKFQEGGFFVLRIRNYVWDETKGPNGGGAPDKNSP